jgi:hypothetical protein
MAAAEYVARHQLAGTIQKALTEALATKQPDNPYQALSAWFQAKPLATAAAPAASAFGPDLLDADIQGAIFDIDGAPAYCQLWPPPAGNGWPPRQQHRPRVVGLLADLACCTGRVSPCPSTACAHLCDRRHRAGHDARLLPVLGICLQ